MKVPLRLELSINFALIWVAVLKWGKVRSSRDASHRIDLRIRYASVDRLSDFPLVTAKLSFLPAPLSSASSPMEVDGDEKKALSCCEKYYDPVRPFSSAPCAVPFPKLMELNVCANPFSKLKLVWKLIDQRFVSHFGFLLLLSCFASFFETQTKQKAKGATTKKKPI